MPKEVYYDMINQKTASLIAASCELGAITTTNDKSDRKSTFEYGNNLGMAFQIKDDLFDFLGSENETGKDSGGDVKKNMITLPLIFCLENATRSEKKKLKTLVGSKKKSSSNLREINDLISELGGFDYSKNKLQEFSDKAVAAIDGYDDSETKNSLIKLVEFNVSRLK